MPDSTNNLTQEAAKLSSGLAMSQRIPFAIWGLLGLSVICLPGILSYIAQLETRDYYGFWPFSILATVWFVWSRADKGFQISGVAKGRWVRRTLFCCASLLLLIAAAMTRSVWPLFAGYLFGVGLILDFANERGKSRSLIYLLLPLLLMLRPPLALDETVVQRLQNITSILASEVLTTFRVDHLLAGNTIQLIDKKPLLVEQACSGIQSLFTLMFVAATWGTSQRHSVFRTLLLVTTAVYWAVLMNVVRVVAIAIADVGLDLDLSSGWKHEALGYAGILVACPLLLCTDKLINFMVGAIDDNPSKHPAINPFVLGWNRAFTPEVVSVEGSAQETRTRVKTRKSESGLWDKRVAIATGLVLLLTAGASNLVFGLQQNASEGVAGNASLPEVARDWVSVEEMPTCQLLKYDSVTREVGADFGQQSNQWVAASSIGPILHSIDYTFDGWHDLTVCYRSIGWTLIGVESRQPAGPDGWPFVYAEFLKPSGERAALIQSMFTAQGVPLETEARESLVSDIKGRLRKMRGRQPKSFQVQSLYESLSMNTSNLDFLIKAHTNVRVQLKMKLTDNLTDQSSD